MYAIREVQRGNYDDRGYSNEETIAHLMLTKPSEINSMLTYTLVWMMIDSHLISLQKDKVLLV